MGQQCHKIVSEQDLKQDDILKFIEEFIKTL